jgi:microcystin-dependent protein
MMKRVLLACLCVAALADSRPAAAQAYEPFLGEIMIVPYTFCPKGWLPTDGRLMSITQNTALFSLLGTNFGGDGRLTFALPLAKPMFDANGVPLMQCISLFGVFPSRN